MNRLRASFAARLLAGSVALVTIVVTGISAYLVVAFDRQTRSTALGTVDDRARVLVGLLDRITGTTATSIVQQISAQAPLVAALQEPTPGPAVRALLTAAGISTPVGHYLAVLGPDGTVLVSTLPASLPAVDSSLPSVRRALAVAGPALGVEVLGAHGTGSPGLVSVDAAERVSSSGGPVLGVVVDVAPMIGQFQVFGPAVGPASQFSIGFVAASAPTQLLLINQSGTATTAVAPQVLADAVRSSGDSVNDTWAGADPTGAATTVAASFQRVIDAAGVTTGYIGVQAPLSAFPGNTSGEVFTLLTIALLILLVTSIVVVLFVDRFVRRPVARLEAGVARIAGGDYASDIPVTTGDELGRLAGSVNRMRREIQENVSEIERGRARLDAAVDRLGTISRALTTTASGVAALENAVVRSAAAIVGAGSAAAVLLRRDGDALRPSASVGVAGLPVLDAWGVVPDLLAGRGARVAGAPTGWSAGGLLAVPMFYQEQVVGAVAVMTRPGTLPANGDEQSLSVLANNAAVALENTRLFEQERQTVQRLRELDTMKSDFLATVQHELRTPLTAIMGMSDLLEMCWQMWGDAEKLGALADIQSASRSLYDLVETIIDFSLLERDTLGLHPEQVPVGPAVAEALETLAARSREGVLPVHVDLAVPEGVSVYADPNRFRQVVRALLDNASKFTPAGGHVTVRGGESGDRVRIDVLDDGVGIPETALPRIFDRFYQVDNSATRVHGGTGMGLALVARLVEAHGARVEVQSAPGRGSRFTLDWPATAAAAGGELASPNGHVDEPAGI